MLRRLPRPRSLQPDHVLRRERGQAHVGAGEIDAQLPADRLGRLATVGAGLDDGRRPPHRVAAGVDGAFPGLARLRVGGDRVIRPERDRAAIEERDVGPLPNGDDDVQAPVVARLDLEIAARHRHRPPSPILARRAQLVSHARQDYDPPILQLEADRRDQFLQLDSLC